MFSQSLAETINVLHKGWFSGQRWEWIRHRSESGFDVHVRARAQVLIYDSQRAWQPSWGDFTSKRECHPFCSSSGTALILSNVGKLLLYKSFTIHLSLRKVTVFHKDLAVAEPHWKRCHYTVCLGPQNHECGLWFRNWSLNNVEEFHRITESKNF